MGGEPGPGRRDWSRYPPLLAVLAALAIAIAVLPSALTTPQSDPSTTLEYAPVTEGDDARDPDGGNVSSLGLGRSGTLRGEVATEAAARAGAAGAAGKSPRTKRCVGRPPRQTEDPLSPPCVAHFQGDNFGDTSPGVTREEARVLVYFDGRGGGCQQLSGRGLESCPASRYFDLGAPPTPDEFVFARMVRLYQRHFNDRYQTYDRFVRVVVHFGRTDLSPEGRRADAADALTKVQPFAVVTYAAQNADAYLEAMAERGVLTFAGSRQASAGIPAAFFRKHPGQIWSYGPSVENRARTVAGFVCRKVAPHTVSFSGNPGDAGKPRKIGLLRTTNTGFPDLIAYAERLRAGAEACGAKIAAEATFPNPNCGECADSPQYAADAMARFQREGVTTVLQAGGLESRFTKSAAAIGYRPEWLVAGDNRAEWNLYGRTYQDQSVWRHARAVTIFTRVTSVEAQHCFVAARDADPEASASDVRNYACAYFPDLRQLFTAVQVAGPRLNAANVDRGFHAIPGVASDDPTVPACFYDAGDYTCVKDAQVQWWDPDERAPDANQPGCWRMMRGGGRHLHDGWTRTDAEADRGDFDQCNSQGSELS